MRLEDEQHYLGAALMQIAENDRFSSINPLVMNGQKLKNAFLINETAFLFLKYRHKGEAKSYRFHFSADHLTSIEMIGGKDTSRVFVGLVCLEDRQVCCLDLEQLTAMMHTRNGPGINQDADYTVSVMAEDNRMFRVFGRETGGNYQHDEVKIARNRFPECILT